MSILSSLTKHAIEQALYYAFVLSIALCALNQVRKPGEWLGRFFLWMMNVSHSALTDWGLDHVHIEKTFAILDVGCGGGRTIQKLAAIATQGKVCGVDHAKGSVAASLAKNAELIKAGRVEVKQTSVSDLPFPEDQFNLVTAVETQYYWPDLINDMKEIRRVLRPSGTLVVIAESYRHGSYDRLQRPVMKLLRSKSLGVDDHREVFSNSGYADI